jgi:hypothetical protein
LSNKFSDQVKEKAMIEKNKRFQIVFLCLVFVASVFLTQQKIVQSGSDNLTIFLPIIQHPIPHNVVIVNSDFSDTQGPDRYVVGEIINTTDSTVYDVTVNVQFTDADLFFTYKNSETLFENLPPNQVTPFKVSIRGLAEPIQFYEVTWAYSSSVYPDYRPLTIVSQQLHDNFGTEVYGIVRNDTLGTLYDVLVAITYYNSIGKVVDVYYTLLRGQIFPPGSETNFQIDTLIREGAYSTYHLQAEGTVLP